MADGDPEPEKTTNESITESIFKHLTDDKDLTDDDRKSIGEGIATKTGGKLPEPVKPKTDHWSEKKLW